MPTIAAAQTVISTKVTVPVRTSTAANGSPSAVDVGSAGSVVPASGTAITIDSNNAVTNEGTIQVTDANGAIGIEAVDGVASGITNSAAIIVDESYTPTDADNDGDLDGTLASGSGRYGIRTDGAFAGAITNAAAGTITVEGNDSAGIRLGGPLAGSLTSLGTVTVTGDRSVGIDTGAITGDALLSGTVTATGADAVGIRTGGPISGLLTIQGAISSTGYRSTTLPTSTDTLDADDLLQGGSAMAIQGDVGGGVVFAVPPSDLDSTNADEDADGIADASEGTASIRSYGAAPAVIIGAADHAVTIGPIAGQSDGVGLLVNGTVYGQGIYAGVSATGFQVGGLGGGVSLSGGMLVAGSIQGISNGADATGLRIGADATVSAISVSGSVLASGGTAGSLSRAIQIDAGASVPTVSVTGTVSAYTASTDGTAVAIRDSGGTVSLLTNAGGIVASGATAGTGRNVAIDLSAGSAGVTVRQAGNTAALISGDILLTSAADTLDVQSGGVSANVSFGGGGDTMSLSGSSAFAGNVDFGGSPATLSIAETAIFTGTLSNAGALGAAVNGGTLRVTAPATIGSLSVGEAGTLGVALSGTTITTPALTVNGSAAFASGATIEPLVVSTVGVEGSHIAVSAGQLTGGETLTLNQDALPFLYTAALGSSGNQVTVDIARKSASDLGLSAREAAIYEPAYAAIGGDADLSGVILSLTDATSFAAALDQLLPDQSDATFEMATLGARTLARITDDPQGLIRKQGRWGYWVAPLGWQSKMPAGATSGFSITGWGLAGGAEMETGVGTFGASLGYLHSHDDTPGTVSEISDGQYTAAGYWRGVWGGFETKARVSYSRLDFDSTRHFSGTYGTTTVYRTASADWGGDLAAASGSASYEMGNETWFFRPIAALDYNRLGEGAHAETDADGTGFALSVAGRTSDELAATASIAAGFDAFAIARDFLGARFGESWFRLEAEAGRREIVAGQLGDTVAQFADGAAFTLNGSQRDSGWIGRVRAMGGSSAFRIAAEVGGEERDGHVALTARANLRISMF